MTTYRHSTTPLGSRSYARGGLVFQLDAIDNTGTGAHDSNAKDWVELVNGVKLTGSSSTIVRDIEVWLNPSGNYSLNRTMYEAIESAFASSDSFTIETRFFCNGSISTNGISLRMNPDDSIYMNWSNNYQPPILFIRPTFSKGYFSTCDCSGEYVTIALVKRRNDSFAYVNGQQVHQSLIADFTDKTLGFFYIHGFISALRVYDRPLDEYEIAKNYEIDKVRYES